MHYPKWVYHSEKEPMIVQSKDHHDSIGKGWEESPAAFEEAPKEIDVPVKKSPKKKKGDQ